MPFFLYLLQHLLLGDMQFLEHTLVQIEVFDKVKVGFSEV
jgi:hypothetical protein